MGLLPLQRAVRNKTETINTHTDLRRRRRRNPVQNTGFVPLTHEHRHTFCTDQLCQPLAAFLHRMGAGGRVSIDVPPRHSCILPFTQRMAAYDRPHHKQCVHTHTRTHTHARRARTRADDDHDRTGRKLATHNGHGDAASREQHPSVSVAARAERFAESESVSRSTMEKNGGFFIK